MNKIAHKTISNGVPLIFQLITLTITTLIIIFSTYRFMHKFCPLDKRPELFQITPKTLKNYTTLPAKVRVGLSILNFAEFNTVENKFTVSVIVWFYFDPSLISLETVNKFSFEQGEIKDKQAGYAAIIGDKLFARYNVRVEFKTNLIYKYFPFQDHKVFLAITNNFVTLSEMIYESSTADFVIPPAIFISGWNLYDHQVYPGYDVTRLGAEKIAKDILYPKVIFEMDCSQNTLRFITMILLPLFFFFFIEMFSLNFDQKKYKTTLIGISTANVSALIAYRFVIESLTPKVGYLLMSDFIFFTFLGMSFSMFIINGFGPYFTARQRKIQSLIFQGTLIGVFTYLFNFWSVC